MLRRVFRDRKEGFYIDVGAMDPVDDSVTKAFYDQGWSGINVEPDAPFYSKLLEDRPRDINLNLAVGDCIEARTFYAFGQPGNSTLDQSTRDDLSAQGLEERLQSKVRITTLAAICREHVRREIDFLKIDCEGWEKQVIEGADWDRFRPTVLVVEATKPNTATPVWSEWEPLLVENGRYEMVYFDGLNRFYLRREYADLREHFATPPNIFDGFIAHVTVAAQQARRQLEEERNSLAAQVLDLDRRLNAALAGHSKITEALKTANAGKESTQNALSAAEQSIQDLSTERDSLAARLTEQGQEIGTKTTELASVRAAVAEAEQSIGSLRLERDIAVQEVVELQSQSSKDRTCIGQLNENLAQSQITLSKARLWVGQLSQDLAVLKLKP